MVASGEKLVSSGKCSFVPFKLQKENREVVLRGLTGMSSNINDTPLTKITKQQLRVMLHVLKCEDAKKPKSIPLSIQQLLQQYHDVLKESTCLPPPRDHDHRIPFLHG
ncbi:hypothetical protein LWI28_027047 [Acer negundo]|uniref:Uncharacterized protein n=1 Tax=Acer negundo TaxID=4023 RepID=A0AAD5IEH9_ACENE|nr:hypothetical protein LWI28_027047 [Acer negundo]